MRERRIERLELASRTAARAARAANRAARATLTIHHGHTRARQFLFPAAACPALLTAGPSRARRPPFLVACPQHACAVLWIDDCPSLLELVLKSRIYSGDLVTQL